MEFLTRFENGVWFVRGFSRRVLEVLFFYRRVAGQLILEEANRAVESGKLSWCDSRQLFVSFGFSSKPFLGWDLY